MKSKVSKEARHNGLEVANSKLVPELDLNKPVPIPRPSSTFFLALFLPEGSEVFFQSFFKD